MAAVDPLVECPEPVDWLCCGPVTGTATPEMITRAEQVALTTLRALSANVFDCVQRTIRPCGSICHSKSISTYHGTGRPRAVSPWINSSGQWMNGGCGCGAACGCCEPYSAIHLIDPDGLPVRGIVEVKIDGVTLADTAYRVDVYGGYQLLRTDGARFPCCQNVDLPDTEPDTFSVTYLAGARLDAAGLAAYSALACAMLSECCDPGSCSSLEGVVSVVRQGMSFERADARALFDGRLTGVAVTDRWLATVNSQGALRPSVVRSAEYRPARMMHS